MNGIITLTLVPLRASDSERSEMYSQLLFGERVEILEERDRWLYVRNLTDDYTGWVDKKMIQMLNTDEEMLFASLPSFCVTIPLLYCDMATSNEKMFLPGGSFLPAFTGSECKIGNEIYRTGKLDAFDPNDITGELLVMLSRQYLNAPYIWGGKSIMGIDCSGLAQVVYAMCGISLPRDASEQVDCGNVIDFLTEAKAGDLAFFENAEGKITHVGMLLNTQQIIHASGWVKIESIDSQGIISAKTGEYTHKLRVVKRLI